MGSSGICRGGGGRWPRAAFLAIIMACAAAWAPGASAMPLWRWADSSSGSTSSTSSSSGTGRHLTANAGQCLSVYEEPLPEYTWMSPDHLRRRAQSVPGDLARLRAALDRFKNGEQLKVVFLGGSITAGQGAWDGLSFPSWAETVLNASLGKIGNVKVHNGAVPGTLSSYMSVCHNIHVPKDADIIFVDYSVNDDWQTFPPMDNAVRRPFERLLRKLLTYPRNPAVVLIHSYIWHRVEPPSGVYWSSSERDYREFGMFYGLPELSVRSALWRVFKEGNLPGFLVHRTRADMHGRQQPEQDDQLKDQVFYWDVVHPDGRTGHRFMGEMAAQMVLDAHASVQAMPLTDAERGRVVEQLPPPMLPDNWQSAGDKCFIGPQFLQAIIAHDGWEYKDEGKDPTKPKLGYISETPGSKLLFKINTKSSSHSASLESAQVSVEMSYLKSYVNMGMAMVRCIGGCTCPESKIDGHNDEHNSQLHLHEFEVTQHEECVIEVEVLGESRTGGHHKVKIAAIIISDESSNKGGGLKNKEAVNMVMEGANLDQGGGNFDIRAWGKLM